MLCDKGTDLGGWKNVDAIMERYRLPRDKDQPMVLRSVTGMPVGIVEAMNSQYQRRMQVFRTSKLTDDPADVLWDISDQLNDQRRPVRGNLTPLQLLALPQMQRNAINAKYKRNFITNVGGLKPLVVGNTVRILQMTRKEQEKFHKKWDKIIQSGMQQDITFLNPMAHKMLPKDDIGLLTVKRLKKELSELSAFLPASQ